MTTNDLATGYHRTCGDRLAALEVLHANAAFSDVCRERYWPRRVSDA